MADYLQTREYWANTYWGGAYWGGIAWRHAEVFRANVILNRSISRTTVLNQAVDKDVILNRSVPSTYEELEEV